jgi:hypothetical protein
VTQGDIHSTICVSGWTATVRPSESYTTDLKEQQLASGYAYHGDVSTSDYEEDHLISLELGGSPSSVLNLWPEPYAGSYGARTKDQIENRLNELVCSGQLALAAAQHAIASNWWTAYQTYLGSSAPAPSTAPPPAPARSSNPAPAGCHPKTNAGNCYEAGEYCRASDAGTTGVAGDGEAIRCDPSGTRYRWEPA